MKVAIVLLLVAVGVCSAAFSGSLVQRTQPLLTKATFRASVAASALTKGDKEKSAIVDALIQNVIEKARALIAQVQAHLQALGGHAQALSGIVKAQIQAAIYGLQQAADVATGHIKQTILTLIGNLQVLLNGSGEGEVAVARQLVVQLDIASLIQSALQDTLGQLAGAGSEWIQQLIAQLTPFLDHTQDIIAQIVALLTGSQQLNRAAPRGIFELIAHFRPIIAALHASLADGLQQAQDIAHGLIAQAVADGQASAAAAVQHIIGQINSLPSWLSDLAQPLVQILEGLGHNEEGATF